MEVAQGARLIRYYFLSYLQLDYGEDSYYRSFDLYQLVRLTLMHQALLHGTAAHASMPTFDSGLFLIEVLLRFQKVASPG